MPNLFSKIASQNGTIKLFGGGVQLKSLVSVIDVARCISFMEKLSIKREIFHVSNGWMTVKDVAEICKKYTPTLNLEYTDDEIPNKGYTISNQKLKDAGFEFLYDIEDTIKGMIEKLSVINIPSDLEYKIKGGNSYEDNRGIIMNYELPEPINLIGYIESKEATVRANHYHPIQEQKCLLIKGKYISVTKDLTKENAPIDLMTINEGDIAVIKPNVAHAMVFLKDSIFLNLVRGEREHHNYGVTHTIPHVLVDEEMKISLIRNYLGECRVCRGNNLKKVINLGLSPLANNLCDTGLDSEKADKFPLQLDKCSDCHNVQLNYVVPPKKMFDNYLYVSSTSANFRKHFEDAAKQYIEDFNLNENSLVVDIGSNDGIFLKPLKERGINICGVEPAKNISDLANKNGIETLNSYFNDSTWEFIQKQFGKADIITASNVFAHSHDIEKIAKLAFQLLKDNGSFIIEVQYFLDTIKDLTFDNIYHEHVNYWTVVSLHNFFYNLGLYIYKVEHINTHGGSIRVYVGRAYIGTHSNIERGYIAAGVDKNDGSLLKFLIQEEELGIMTETPYKEFAQKVLSIKEKVRKNFDKLNSINHIIALYGCPAKATTALNYYGLTDKDIAFAIEDNPLKVGKFIPIAGIPIVDKSYCDKILPDAIIVMAWNFIEEIKKNNQDLIEKGVKFISIKDLEK